jgi:hypothetical protein
LRIPAFSIEGVVEAARLGLIDPILVGPPARISDDAEHAKAEASTRFAGRLPPDAGKH